MVKKKYMNNKLNYNNLINLLFIIIIFTACLWDVGSLERIRVVDDGFCYWGIGAVFSGYDWTDLISASAYYSYGYSFILIPLFWLHRLGLSMPVIYRLAIVLNAFMLSGCYLMALYMIKELFKDIPDRLKQIIALFATLYIGNTAQMGLAWSETFLLFMFWCTLVLLYRVIKKPGYGNIFGLALTSSWLFAIHMRSVGVVIAVCIVILGFFVTHRKEIDKKYFVYTIALSLVFLFIVIAFKNYVNDYMYIGNATESTNNVQANVNRLGNFLSVKGVMDLALSYIGKLFYASSATFVFSMVGLVTAVSSLLFGYIFKDKSGARKRWQTKQWVTCFVLLSFLAEFGISAIFKALPIVRTKESKLGNDTLIFSRYSDFVVGPMIILGVWAVYNLKTQYKEIMLAVLISIASAAVVQFSYDIMAFRKKTDTVGFRFAAAPWFNRLVDGHKTDFAYGIMMLGIGVLIALCFIRLLMEYKWHIFGASLIVLAGVWGVLGILGGVEYTQSKLSKEKGVDTVAHILETTDDSVPIYMFGGANTEVKILQWLLADRPIHTCEFEDIDNIDTANALILGKSANTQVITALSERLDFLYDSGYIAVFGNPESEHYDGLSAKAKEMAHEADPTIRNITLADVATEYSYTKVNGSLYYNYQGTDGGYMTKEMGVTLQDGIYEFIIDMRIRDCTAGTEIGYITVGDADGNVQYTKPLNADDFIKKPRQKISVSVEIQDYAEPVIGVYTHGQASIRIYDISYRKADGCICLDSDETEDIAQLLETQAVKKVCYVDSDNSAQTGFPWWEHGSLDYLSGQMLEFKSDLEDAYYIVEKTDMAVVAVFADNMSKLQETESYQVFTIENGDFSQQVVQK